MAGEGYLITAKFIHENAEILDLQKEDANEPVGTTLSHPFWSEDRQQFVAAGELRIGESLLRADAATCRCLHCGLLRQLTGRKIPRSGVAGVGWILPWSINRIPAADDVMPVERILHGNESCSD